VDVKQQLAGLTVLAAVLVLGTAAWGAPEDHTDPGARVCGYVNAGVVPDDPAGVGRMAADSAVPEIAEAGMRLRDATTAEGRAAAAGQLARVCLTV